MGTDEPRPCERTQTAGTSSRMLGPGSVLAARYRIVEVAGAGGMGIVYRARDLDLDIDVAIKLIEPGRLADEIAMERFRSELLLSRQVSHRNVVRIHDIGRDGNVTFMTMDYRPARTLSDVLSGGPLSPAAALGVARQIAAALGATHREEVVHRDVKPGNILLADDGHAWLCDFGIARSLDQGSLTAEGTVLGTIQYLAPEQVRGESVDGRTDLYALGLVMWEMFTGTPLARDQTRDETLAQRAAGIIPAALDNAPQIPRGLRRIIRRCLASDPADRYQDADALLADLNRGFAGLALKRNVRWTAGTASAVAAVLLVWLWWPGMGSAPVDQPGPPQSIAVLPLVNSSGAPELDWVRRGLSEVITSRLAESPDLQVIDSIRVSRTLGDLRLDPEQLDAADVRSLGELFAVRHLVTGRLFGSGRQLRLQLRLVAPADGRSSNFNADSGPEALVASAERLADAMLDELMLPAPEVPATPRLSSDPEALNAFDAGVERLAQSDRTKAIAELERAVALDESFGLAWLRLADAYGAAGYRGQALEAVERAVVLLGEPGGRLASWALARREELAGNTDQAVVLFERMINRYPHDNEARLALGALLIELGRLDQARAMLDTVTRDDPQNPAAWFLLGKAAIIAGDVAAAGDEYLVRALVIQNRFGNAEGQGEVLNALGIANERLGRLAQAGEFYAQAVALRETAGDLRGTSASLANLARLRMIDGEFGPAREALKRALAVRQEMGDMQGVASALNELGVLEEEVGDYAAALSHYREALRLYEDLGGGRGVAEAYTNLAFTYQILGQLDNAEVFSERAERVHRQRGNSEWLMSTLLADGELRVARGDWNAAQAALVEAMELARQLQSPYGEAAAQGGIGTLAWHQGRAGAALGAYGEARAILEPIGDVRGLVEYSLRSAELLLALGLSEAAGEHLAEARALLGEGGSVAQKARLVLGDACVDAGNGRPESAASEMTRAAELAEASGSRVLELQVAAGRLRCLGGDITLAHALRDAAAEIGHRPYLLSALRLLAERQLEYGQRQEAEATIRTALRPPLALEPWIGNWHLYQLLARCERESGKGDGAEARERARLLVQDIARGLPAGIGPMFLARADVD
ncbi:MAG: protein kinase [Woeseia sp.]